MEERPPGALVVLVVDDCRDTAESWAFLLRAWGHVVLTAHDGPGALAAVAGCRPDVVLLDIGLPRMDGYEVARRLRQMPEAKGARLLAVSGWCREEDQSHAREAGCDLHLAKPVFPEWLRDYLEQLKHGEVEPCHRFSSSAS